MYSVFINSRRVCDTHLQGEADFWASLGYKVVDWNYPVEIVVLK